MAMAWGGEGERVRDVARRVCRTGGCVNVGRFNAGEALRIPASASQTQPMRIATMRASRAVCAAISLKLYENASPMTPGAEKPIQPSMLTSMRSTTPAAVTSRT